MEQNGTLLIREMQNRGSEFIVGYLEGVINSLCIRYPEVDVDIALFHKYYKERVERENA